MSFKQDIAAKVKEYFVSQFDAEIDDTALSLAQTKKEFAGDYTIVVFPFVRIAKSKPEALGESLGAYLKDALDYIIDYNVVKGFLNLSFSSDFWHNQLIDIETSDRFGDLEKNGEKVLVEFSSPNTNKPLHLGHIRNILLGWSCSKILAKAGYDVKKVQIVNDRGIAVCKSMLAWKLFSDGETPESIGMKPDFFVGKYYVIFDTKLQEEYKAWQKTDAASELFTAKKKEDQTTEDFFKKYKNTYFNEYSSLGGQAREMLLAWEDNDPEVRALWEKMNNWVYAGLETTYEDLGVDFDQLYYESNTYLHGKKTVAQGLKDGLFYQKEDGSIWIDLEDSGMDQKILLRGDGTSVYLTQDLGTAEMRYDDHQMSKMIYVVGDEQDYHFQVLFETLKILKKPFADGLFHLSYGMVDLPDGKMKSREGTVVDADVLIAEVINEAKTTAEERGDLEEFSEAERSETYRSVGLGALKYFILKVGPKKRITFNPKESLDMQGQTGPYIQNAYVRIQSVIRKNGEQQSVDISTYQTAELEQQLIRELLHYKEVIRQAAKDYDPALVANYSYGLAKAYHRFYHDFRILKAESEEAKQFRLLLSKNVAKILASSMDLLGIEMPERM